jgi:hypothetical protein
MRHTLRLPRFVDMEGGRSEKEPKTVPQTKPVYTEEFKREVPTWRAPANRSIRPPPIWECRPTA